MGCGMKSPDSNDICGDTYTCGTCQALNKRTSVESKMLDVLLLLAFHVMRGLTDNEAKAEIRQALDDIYKANGRMKK